MIPRRRTAKPSTSPRLLLAAACAVLSACGGDSTAPPTPHVQLILTGAAAPALEHSTYPDGSWRVDCGEQITAELRGDAGASVTWDGISFFWHDASSGKLLISQSYPADSISRFLGANTLVTGATQQLNWDFWNETPFSVYVVFQYHVTGAENAGQSEEFDFRCAPVAPAPAGTFVLSSINDDPLP